MSIMDSTRGYERLDPQWHSLVCLGHDGFEGPEVGLLAKQPQPTLGPIEHMT